MATSIPSLRSVAKVAARTAQLILSLHAEAIRGDSCPNAQVSCRNSTVVQDLCCFNAPLGQLLLTQFWDTSPPTGPNNEWTLHGLWPDRCDGTYDANCDSARAYTNITQILQVFGKADLLAYAQTYWKDYQGDDETFWEHEWGKHGTCVSTLRPSCYSEYKPTQEVVDYFQKALDQFKALPSYQWLEDASIIPSAITTYTSDEIEKALSAQHGFPVTIRCRNGVLNEIWYHYNVRGSLQDGTFLATSPDGSKSSCPSTGVKYLPKSGGHSSGTTTITTATQTTTSTPTATGSPFEGKGFLQVQVGGKSQGCIISNGKWYIGGTCATFRTSDNGNGFGLSSSKGKCAISDNAFTCASDVTSGTVFTSANGQLVARDNTSWYADSIPSRYEQQAIYTSSHTTEIAIQWGSI